MARTGRERTKASKPAKASAPRRKRREGVKRSLNLSVCVDLHQRFRGLAILLDRDPSELLMDWIEEKTAGMRFYVPGTGGEDAAGEGIAEAPAEESPDTIPCRREVG